MNGGMQCSNPVAAIRRRVPPLQYMKSRFNKDILARCPSLTALYRACPFLTNGHVETIFAAGEQRAE